MINKLKKDTKLYSWLLLNFAASFMFCIFAPLDAYYANKDEFWFTMPQMMSVCGIVLLILLTLLNLTALVLSRTKFSDILLAAFSSLLFYFYIQGNFIPRNYGVLDGGAIDWSAYPIYAASSVIIGILSLCLFILLLKKFRKQLLSFARIEAGILLCILTVTSTVLILRNGISSNNASLVVSDKNLFSFSSDHNILVIILDSYDSAYLRQLLEEDYENTASIYENFTYYPDTLGGYNLTELAVPLILTGQWYQNEEPYVDYIQQANAASSLYQTLNQTNFTSEIYSYHSEFFSPESSLPENITPGTYEIADKGIFAAKLFKLMAFDYAPHQLKQLFYIDTNEFVQCRTSNLTDNVFQWQVVPFANRIANETAVSQTGNLFKLIHLEGCHLPSTFGKDLQENGAIYTEMDEARGNNEVMRQYFEALKSAGIYDQSTIIIMADHGLIEQRQNPVFMVKNAGENHSFTISDAEMSYEYLPEIWTTLSKGEAITEQEIQSYTPEYGKRRFLKYNHNRFAEKGQDYYIASIQEYFCEGPAYDPDSITPSGKYYLSQKTDYSYTLNTKIKFNYENNVSPEGHFYVAYGNGGVKDSGMVLTENCLMKFDFQEKFENLYVQLTLANAPDGWTYNIEANGHVIHKILLSEDKKIVSFIIPRDILSQEALDLHIYKNDGNDMAGAFIETDTILKNLTISSIPVNRTLQQAAEDAVNRYYLGDLLEFNAYNSSGIAFLQNKTKEPVETGTEIINRETALRFILQEKCNEYLAILKYQAPEEGIHVRFYVNDTLIQEQDVRGIESLPLSIPQEAIPDGCTLNLRIELPDIEDGTSTAFYLKALTINKKDR